MSFRSRIIRASAALELGKQGEALAARMLRSRGFVILDTNWRSGCYELDIVAEDHGELVFVEVKTRTRGGKQRPDEALTTRKQQHLIQAARRWLAAHHAWDRACRFDLVCILAEQQTFSMEHIPHAFDLSSLNRHSLDCGHTAWQPW